MKTILLIDENDMMRDNTSEILKLSNYTVLSVESSRRGFEVAVNKLPDLIIWDLLSSQAEGMELVNKIRETEALILTPIVLISQPVEREKAGAGVVQKPNDYLIKPFNGNELLRIVSKYLEPEREGRN